METKNDIEKELNEIVHRHPILTYLFNHDRTNYEKPELISVEHNSIRRKKNFYKYFSSQIFKNDISFKDIQKLINNIDRDKILNEAVIKDNPENVLRRLQEYSLYNEVNQNNVIRLFLYLSLKYPDKYSISTHLMFVTAAHFIEVKGDELNLSFYHEFLDEIFNEQILSVPHVALDYLDKLTNQQFILRKTDREYLHAKILLIINYFDSHNTPLLKENISQLNRALSNLIEEDIRTNNSLERMNGIKDKYLNYITKRYLKPFLESSISNSSNGNFYTLNRFYRNLIKDSTKAQNMIYSFDEEYVKEYIKFSELSNKFYDREEELVWYFNALNVDSYLPSNPGYRFYQQVVISYKKSFEFFSQIQSSDKIKISYGVRNIFIKPDTNYMIITAPIDRENSLIVQDVNRTILQIVSDHTLQVSINELPNGLLNVYDRNNGGVVLKYVSIQPAVNKNV